MYFDTTIGNHILSNKWYVSQIYQFSMYLDTTPPPSLKKKKIMLCAWNTINQCTSTPQSVVHRKHNRQCTSTPLSVSKYIACCIFGTHDFWTTVVSKYIETCDSTKINKSDQLMKNSWIWYVGFKVQLPVVLRHQRVAHMSVFQIYNRQCTLTQTVVSKYIDLWCFRHTPLFCQNTLPVVYWRKQSFRPKYK